MTEKTLAVSGLTIGILSTTIGMKNLVKKRISDRDTLTTTLISIVLCILGLFLSLTSLYLLMVQPQ